MTVPNGSTTRSEELRAPQDRLVRLGGWLFRRRSWLPLPIVVALLVIPRADRAPAVFWGGVALAALGEMVRLWAVRHIGVISRTRSDRLGPLVASGPFNYVRNPLYLGNIALWLGFTLSAGLIWFAPMVLGLLMFEYHAIVRWEEHLLAARLGDGYQVYLGRVPRWIPSFRPSTQSAAGSRSWRETLFSERSTLAAMALGCVILWAKP